MPYGDDFSGVEGINRKYAGSEIHTLAWQQPLTVSLYNIVLSGWGSSASSYELLQLFPSDVIPLTISYQVTFSESCRNRSTGRRRASTESVPTGRCKCGIGTKKCARNVVTFSFSTTESQVGWRRTSRLLWRSKVRLGETSHPFICGIITLMKMANNIYIHYVNDVLIDSEITLRWMYEESSFPRNTSHTVSEDCH